MPKKTDFNEYEIPVPFDISTEDTNVWGKILNAAFEDIDTDIILRGEQADKPFPKEKGRLFLDESSQRIELDNGDKWGYLGAQLEVLDDGAHITTTPWELDVGSDLSATKAGAGRLRIDVEDSFVRLSGDTMTGPLTLGGDLSATNGEIIWDESLGYIPQAQLENDGVTITSGNALTGGAALSLGGSLTLNVDETAIDHTNLIGLATGDDHTQYIHKDARRGFTNPVDGQQPTTQTHLTTKDYVDSQAQGLEYKESVISEGDTPPGTPASGDRYLVDAAVFAITAVDTTNEILTVAGDQSVRFDAGESLTVSGSTGNDGAYSVASVAYDSTNDVTNITVNEDVTNTTADGDILHADGAWNGHINELTEHDGTSWTFNVANEGWSVFIEDVDKLKTYNGIDWVLFGATIAHDALQGLADDDHTQYLHTDGRRAMDASLDMGGFSIRALDKLGAAGELNHLWPDNPSTGGDLEVGYNSQNTIRFGGGATNDLTSIEFASGDLLDSAGNLVYDQTNTQVPQARIEQGAGSGLDSDTVDGYQALDLRNPQNIAQLTSTDTTTDINTTAWVTIPWDTEYTLDSAYTHDAVNTPGTITFDEAGTYKVWTSIAYDATAADVSPSVKLSVNGVQKTTHGLGGYVSNTNGKTESMTTVMRTITVAAGDSLVIEATQTGNAGTATMRSEESILEIEQLSVTSAMANDANTLDGLDSSQFLRSDANDTTDSTLSFNRVDTSDVVQHTDNSAGTATSYTYRYDDLPLRFWFNNSAAATNGTTLYLDQAGQVGIGKTTVNYQLDVGGIANVDSDIIVDGDITSGATTIWDSVNAYIPETSVQQGPGSGLDADTLDGKHLSEVGVDAEDDGTVVVSGTTAFNFGTNLSVTDDLDGTVTVDGSGNLEASANETITGSWDFNALTEFTVNLRATDDAPVSFGTTDDFQLQHVSADGDLVLTDSNGIELIRQPKGAATQFAQGAELGAIQAPEDSYSQIINSASTSAVTAGARVGYNFAVDSVSGYALDAEADGAGGLQNLTHRWYNHSGIERMRLTSTGDLKVEGSITEGAAL